MRLAPPVGRWLRCAVADDAGVDAAPRQFAAQTAKFDFGAAVHDDFDAGRLGFFGGRVVADTQLHPDDLGTDRDGVIDDRPDLIGGAEDVDHVDLLWDVAQGGMDFFAQLLLAGGAGVDRDDAVAFALQATSSRSNLAGSSSNWHRPWRWCAPSTECGAVSRRRREWGQVRTSLAPASRGHQLSPRDGDGNREPPAVIAVARWGFRRYRDCWIADRIQCPPRARTNVHSSVASTRSVGLPSTTRPEPSRVTSIIENRIATAAYSLPASAHAWARSPDSRRTSVTVFVTPRLAKSDSCSEK